MADAVPNLDPFSTKFTEFAEGEFLEIGAAYGYATLKALENGASVTANDIDERHLQQLIENAHQKGYTKLTTSLGSFPSELNYQENQFSKILISRVLHFYTGEKMLELLKVLKSWLQPKGSLYIVCETNHLSNWKAFFPEYQRRLDAGLKYPGEVYNPQQWEEGWSDNIPEFIHLVDLPVLKQLVIEAGFKIVEADYIDRKGQFPESLLLDGRESVGVIAEK
ncbi:class I SAM-dependent methyltransferase [Parashewanella curva]|uniref:Class I SAM-dependent methyltransferase n=1 Tax=Parashewanella curva TaxID=2338552 RepID=A0A3L8PRL0_9GAMM|nr:class I SAM-dependent methyltransferase [Parashewanella curva]RLV58040.1 class I SAM-dependent methyltransferase [Parashewanella curva]